MTAILPDFDTSPFTPAPSAGTALQLPAASGMGRAFLVVQFAPPTNDASSDRGILPRAALSTDDEIQAFVAELRELGGMAVIA